MMLEKNGTEVRMHNNDRQYWIDLAKGIAMFMVVLGHCGHSYFYISLYYIHLPIFIVISGYLLAFRNAWQEKTVWENICKKSADIMFPYIVFGIIFVIINCIRLCVNGGNLLLAYTSVQSVLLLENNTNWFLPSLFFSEVLFIVIHKWSKGDKRVLLIAMILMLGIADRCSQIIGPFRHIFHYAMQVDHFEHYLSMWIGRCSAFLFYLILGYFLYFFYEHYKEKRTVRTLGYISIALSILVIFITNQMPMVDLHFLLWENTLVYFNLGSIGAVSTLIALSILQPRCKALEELGKRSLAVNGLHGVTSIIPLFSLIAETIIPGHLYDSLPETIITTVVAIAVCVVIMRIIIPVIERICPSWLNYSALNQIIVERTTK